MDWTLRLREGIQYRHVYPCCAEIGASFTNREDWAQRWPTAEAALAAIPALKTTEGGEWVAVRVGA